MKQYLLITTSALGYETCNKIKGVAQTYEQAQEQMKAFLQDWYEGEEKENILEVLEPGESFEDYINECVSQGWSSEIDECGGVHIVTITEFDADMFN